MTEKTITEQIADHTADLDYYDHRIAAWETKFIAAYPGTDDANLIAGRLARLEEQRIETRRELRRLRQLDQHGGGAPLIGSTGERVTQSTPKGTPVIYRTHRGETRTGVFTGGVSRGDLVNRDAITTDELSDGARRYEVAVDSNVGSVVWVEVLFVRD